MLHTNNGMHSIMDCLRPRPYLLYMSQRHALLQELSAPSKNLSTRDLVLRVPAKVAVQEAMLVVVTWSRFIFHRVIAPLLPCMRRGIQ